MKDSRKDFVFPMTAFEEHALLTAINCGLRVLESRGDEKSRLVVKAVYGLAKRKKTAHEFEESGQKVVRLMYEDKFTPEEREASFDKFKHAH